MSQLTEQITLGMNMARSTAVEDGTLLWELSGTA